MDQIKIGAFIAQLRREKGWTQEELGERLGITNKTVSRWENGNYMPSIEMLTLLGREFGVTLNELLEGRRLETEDEFRAAADEKLATAMARPGERFRRWLDKYGVCVGVVVTLCAFLWAAAYTGFQYRKAHPADIQFLRGTFICRDVFYEGRYTWIYLTFAFDGRYYIVEGPGTLLEYGSYTVEGDTVRLDSGKDVRWAVIKGKRIIDRSPIGEGLMEYERIALEPWYVTSDRWPPEAQPFPPPSEELPN